ncbi:MAG: FAD-dependent oxidoreductase [Dialister sp.]|nr:FAD-dependent oxidoreductase [Dialister sp.]
MENTLPFFEKPAPITDIRTVKEYDVVVVGAGSPGVPCALKAAELGARVAILQKEREAAACGNFGAGIILEDSVPADVESLVSLLMGAADHRAKREVIEMWAQHSGEAVRWLIEQAKEAGAKVMDLGTPAQEGLLKKTGLHIGFTTCVFGPKPYDTGAAMKTLCKLAEKRGIDIFYETPACQLVQDEKGAVTGVIGKGKDGYMQFNAKKGVVIGTGDYANDPAMMDYYLPDMHHMDLKRTGRSGDGHKMIVWAGGRMEHVGHCKMVHDMDAGPVSIMSAPFLRVKLDGRRFCNETVGMEYMNCYLTDKEDKGHYCQIFDSTYIEQAKRLGLSADDEESIKKWMPEEKMDRNGVMEALVDTWKADTLEELAEKLRIRDIPAFLETVKQYNALAKAGKDTEYGVPVASLCPVENGPFYGVHRHVRFTVSCSGIVVNGRLECLDDNDRPIPGLYAIGNLAGNFYGSPDYPLDIFGLNLGRNYTGGYVAAKEIMGQL